MVSTTRFVTLAALNLIVAMAATTATGTQSGQEVGIELLPGDVYQMPNKIPNDIGNGAHINGGIPMNRFEPLQQRYAFAGEGGVTISWNSVTQLRQPTVYYGDSPLAMTENATSNTSITYPTSRMYTNHVTITGLQPAKKYYYRVSYANCAYCAYIPTHTFMVPRVAGDDTPHVVAVFGDLGLIGPDGLSTINAPHGNEYTDLEGNEKNTIQALAEAQDTYEFLIHLGDVGYADYFIKESWQSDFGANNTILSSKEEIANAFESMLEQYFDQMQVVTADKAWMVLPGNHEANCMDSEQTDKMHDIKYTASTNCTVGQMNFTFYNSRFRMPSEESGGALNMWYSYDYGLVHYIVLDAETDLGEGLVGGSDWLVKNGPFGPTNAQQEWAKADLEKVNRTLTPWVVALIHRPWYRSAPYDAGDPPNPDWQKAFETILYDNNVDLVLTGHVHLFARFDPTYNNTIDEARLNNPRAPVYITSGAAGHYDGIDKAWPPDQRPKNNVITNDRDYGWGRLLVHNRTHLTHEYRCSRNQTVLDTATLYKEHNF